MPLRMDNYSSTERTKIVLAFDEEAIRELEDTTETKTPAGNITYHPAKKGIDHNTDALRCIMAAITRYYTMILDQEEFPIDEFGWIEV